MRWWPFKKPAAQRATCRRYDWCEAWAWPASSDGSCKYHCDLYCKCAPVGDARHKLTAVDGGKA